MIRAVIFDLDGTLYKSRMIERRFAEAAHFTLARFSRIDLEEARKLVEQQRAQRSRQKGFRIPYTHTLRSFGVPVKYWHRHNTRFFDPGDHLKKNTGLIKVLRKLGRHYRLAVVTNNNRVQTERILEALGVRQFFSVIQSFTDSGLLKPDRRVFLEVARKLKVQPHECFSVGDRVDVDLIPALKIGMKIFRVASPRGINRFARSKALLS